MRIVLVHNFYGSSAPSGENTVFEAEADMLARFGHEVIRFTRHSDEIRGKGPRGILEGALSTPWNPWSASALRELVEEIKPDVVHAHNTFPLISPAIFRSIGCRAARVVTLHNYRLFCPAGIPLREGKVCTDCLDTRSVWPALRHGCYRGSRLATVPLAANVALHRALGTWSQHVDAFIALTEFQRDRVVRAGLPADLVHVKPNFFPGSPATVAWSDRRRAAVFVGRLSAEKGVTSLLKAWRTWGQAAPELRIVGDGPLRAELQQMASDMPVRFLGQLPASEAQGEIASASLLVLPSECFEGFPMVVREGFAFGTPVAVSNLGPLPTIVEHGRNGLVFQAGQPESLLQVVRSAWNDSAALQVLSVGARRSFETLYNDEANHLLLMSIYQRALAVQAGREK